MQKIKILLITVIILQHWTLTAQNDEYFYKFPPCPDIDLSIYRHQSDSLRKTPIGKIESLYIRGYFRDEFLFFRMMETPGIPDSVKFEFQAPSHRFYNSPEKVLLPDSLVKDIEMEIKLYRWPPENPLPGFFLVEKDKNQFIRRNYYQNPPKIEMDAVVDLYDSLYMFDRFFLIYYKSESYSKKEKYSISGNLNYYTGALETQWDKYFCYSDTWIIYARMAMYGVRELPKYAFYGSGDNNGLYRYLSAKASEIGKNHILIRYDQLNSSKHYTKYNYDVIFFSNEKRFTQDDNKLHVYEIIFSTREKDEKTGQRSQRAFNDLQPQRTLAIDMKDKYADDLVYSINAYIQKKYDTQRIPAWLNIFNGDMSVFPEMRFEVDD